MPQPRRLSPAVFLRRGAFYKGVLGGSRGWLAVGAVLWSGRALRKAFGRTEEVAATEVLRPGQSIQLTAMPMRTKRDRAAARATGPTP